MKLIVFIYLAPSTTLFRSRKSLSGHGKEFYKKSEVISIIHNQVQDDILCHVSKKEIKQRIRNLLDDFELAPKEKTLNKGISDIMKEMRII